MSELQFELSSSSVSRIPTSVDGILSALENGFLSISHPVIPVKDVKEKVIEFQNFLNSVGRISMLHAGVSDREEIVFLLLNLKRCFKTILTELGKTRNKTAYTYNCLQCTQNIVVEPGVNMWCSFQQHLHFEEAYAKQEFKLLENDKTTEVTISPESIPTRSGVDILYENNTDSGIEQVENDVLDRHNIEKLSKDNHSQLTNCHSNETPTEDINGFRFNFQLHYDECVETKFYPDSLVTAVKKFDKIADPTILRAGHYRAICLLCSRDLVSRAKISKSFILDHVMGQRHLKFASDTVNLHSLRCFHETWLNLDMPYQSHQLYFRPDIRKSFKCVLCNNYVLCTRLKQHIQTDPHRKKVIELFERNEKIYFLTDEQVQLYGPEMIAKAQKRIQEAEERKKLQKEERTPKTESESSPSPGKK